MNVNLNDLNCHEYIPHETIIDKISQEIDSVGVDLPIKDGLKNNKTEDMTDDEAENKLNFHDAEDLANHPTSEEEREMPASIDQRREKVGGESDRRQRR